MSYHINLRRQTNFIAQHKTKFIIKFENIKISYEFFAFSLQLADEEAEQSELIKGHEIDISSWALVKFVSERKEQPNNNHEAIKACFIVPSGISRLAFRYDKKLHDLATLNAATETLCRSFYASHQPANNF